MKHVIVIPDGCADEPIDALGGKTPLQAAHMPASEALARRGNRGDVEQHTGAFARRE